MKSFEVGKIYLISKALDFNGLPQQNQRPNEIKTTWSESASGILAGNTRDQKLLETKGNYFAEFHYKFVHDCECFHMSTMTFYHTLFSLPHEE